MFWIWSGIGTCLSQQYSEIEVKTILMTEMPNKMGGLIEGMRNTMQKTMLKSVSSEITWLYACSKLQPDRCSFYIGDIIKQNKLGLANIMEIVCII